MVYFEQHNEQTWPNLCVYTIALSNYRTQFLFKNAKWSKNLNNPAIIKEIRYKI